jgi:hypothetical protein
MPKGILHDQVIDAADTLLLAGERPTVERIRTHLGTGSPQRTRGSESSIRSSVSGLTVREDEPLWLAEAGLRRLAGNR